LGGGISPLRGDFPPALLDALCKQLNSRWTVLSLGLCPWRDSLPELKADCLELGFAPELLGALPKQCLASLVGGKCLPSLLWVTLSFTNDCLVFEYQATWVGWLIPSGVARSTLRHFVFVSYCWVLKPSEYPQLQ
jgi:hypothetical protein